MTIQHFNFQHFPGIVLPSPTRLLTGLLLLNPAALFMIILSFSLLMLSCGDPSNSSTVENIAMTGKVLPAFTDISAAAGLDEFRHNNGAYGKKFFPEQMGAGCGFIDYNQDGWLDILLVGGGEIVANSLAERVPALALYRNNGDDTFTLQTEAAGLGNFAAYGTGIAVADYDNDGDSDFFFTTLTGNHLLRNSNGIFQEATTEAGLDDTPVWSSSSLFFDADQDGWLDLYICNYAAWTMETDVWCSVDGATKVYCPPSMYQGIPSSFYRGNGDGTFSKVEAFKEITTTHGKSLGVAELDFNRDGWPDFVVANDGERDLLYENNGDGTFQEVGTKSGIAYSEYGEARAGMGIDVGDVENNGQETIFVGNFSKEMIGVYRYNGNGWFIDRAAVSKIGRPSLLRLTFGLFLYDADFDNDLDLFVANGHVYPIRTQYEDGISYRQPPQLFLNDGNGVFSEIGDSIGGVFHEGLVARGTAFGDYDRDGDPDILVVENGGAVHLWRNDLTGNAFLRVRLSGTTSNKDGISSRIVAVSGGTRMERRIRSGSSYLSHSENVATFGLGLATTVDSLLIFWPNETKQQFVNVTANQEIKITEGQKQFEVVELPGRQNPPQAAMSQ